MCITLYPFQCALPCIRFNVHYPVSVLMQTVYKLRRQTATRLPGPYDSVSREGRQSDRPRAAGRSGHPHAGGKLI